MLRIYPIRTTRNNWNIKLYSEHKCSENCDIIMEIDENDSEQLIIKHNPTFIDGKCEFSDKTIQTCIRIFSFNKNNPFGEYGKLYNPNEKVIPDNSFTISIFFPLSHVFEIKISSENGFTLSELIYSIKILYEHIYREEERTSTPQIYNLKKSCSSCGINDLSKYIDEIKEEDKLDECSICYSDYLDDLDGCKLKCNHVFHNSCINKWIVNSKTCPICRYNIFMCNKCDGKGVIYYQFTGVVIPLEHRGHILNRNRTNGMFGIYGFDFEDLLLTNMYYDRLKKKLFINITS